MSNAVDGVREVSPREAAVLKADGVVADLSRNGVVVHVGKPVGSITGYVGPLFWQVWADAGDTPGTVHARIDQETAQIWQFDAALSKAEALDQAKERMLAEVEATRAARLAAAQAEREALAA